MKKAKISTTSNIPLPKFPIKDTIFILLSFEGPDLYSQAGGLGVRMAELSRSLAEAGYETHLFFVGDPTLPPTELLFKKLTYHRWGQWISRYHPSGVYDGEEGKLRDYEASVPSWILQNILLAEKNKKKQFVILSEEWHTAGAIITLSNMIASNGLNHRALRLWNANNTFGFHRINWGALQYAATITAVSRYMKHLMWGVGVNAHVIPNGVPKRWFAPIKEAEVKALRKTCATNLLLAKIGRFDPDKRWIMAIQSLALLKQLGLKPKLLLRGGMEPHRHDVFRTADYLGLKIVPIKISKDAPLKNFLNTLSQNSQGDIYDLQFFVTEEKLRLIYQSADAVLANSGHEPFGLVGLEVMACKGIAITGNTGEDYAQSFQNGIVVDGDDPWELASHLSLLMSNQPLQEKLRNAAHKTAKTFEWSNVIEELKRKLTYLSLKQK